MTIGAAGRVLLNSQDVGSGFAVTESRVLTAGHVVRDATRKMAAGRHGEAAGPPGPVLVCVVDRSEPAEVSAVVQYQPEDGDPVPVTRIEVSTSLDVAVLHLRQPAPAVLPAAGQVTAGEGWRVETRPDPKAPVLRGTVTEPRRQLENTAGKEATLIQLWVEQDLGGYQGYSGSPVISVSAGGVLGVLVEQAFWRTSVQFGEKPRVGNVLYAAPIDWVLTEFDLAGVPIARSVTWIPLQASFEVDRPDQLELVMAALTGPSPKGELVGLAGMGGAGKSVLAAAAARDPKMAEAFPGGRFWLELGPSPPLLQLQANLAAALGDSTPITDVPQGRARLSRLLGKRRCLLVLDNVWDRAHVPAFNVMGPSGRVLVTTRDAATVPGATVIPLGELNTEAAMQLLAGWAATMPGELPREAEQVARECGYLPLALAVCGALVNAGSHDWPRLLGLLREADLDALPIQLEDYPHPSLAVALGASIDTLPLDARDRYLRLAVFNGQGPVPVAAVQVLWGLDQQHTSALIEGLAGKSLLRAEDGRISLHDLQMDYLTRCAPNLPALHDRLLAAYRDQCPAGWASGPDDGYFYQHLTHHLRQAARIPELTTLLLDLDWMTTKLATGTIPALLADYDTLPADPAISLVASALRLSAHILASHPGQLPSQLTGRLAGQPDPQLRDLMQRARSWPATPWLRPLTASLTPPGGPLQRTLTGHHGPVYAVAIAADGRRAVSGGYDATVRVWDLDTGEPLHTLAGYRGPVRIAAVAVSADGRRAVSGGYEGTVRVWDLDTGQQQAKLSGHDGPVYAVAVSADGRRAVSGGGDEGTVRVWDAATGEPLHTLAGHDGWVAAVAVSADGRRAVSGGYDATVRVWDAATGEPLHTLAGYRGPVVAVVAGSADSRHDGLVTAVAVTADGRRAVSGGDDGTVRIWDLANGKWVAPASQRLWHRVQGWSPASVRSIWASSVAISADGRRAVSGGDDGTVRVWDLDTGQQQAKLRGHDGWVGAVAVSADGRRAVSGGGGDGTVRVWDLDTGQQAKLRGHDGPVRTVAVSADGRRAASGGDDGTVRVWDLEEGVELAFFAADSRITELAVTPAGTRVIAGASTGSVHLLELCGYEYASGPPLAQEPRP